MNEKQSPSHDMSEALTEKMDQWRQNNPTATLTEIEEAVEAELAQIRKQMVERLASAEVGSSQEEQTCPECGQKMVKNGRKRRRLKAKEGETIELERQQWRCLECGTTLFPPG